MTQNAHPTRRALILSGVAAMAASRTNASSPPRVAALGWAGAQTLLALGVAPIALPEIDRYNRLVVEPPALPGIRELGLRSEPNLELLKRLTPDLIVTEAGAEVANSQLERIAPVADFATILAGFQPIEAARRATWALGSRLGAAHAVTAYLDGFDARIDAAAGKLDAYRGGPLCVAGDMFGNRALVFGANSIYQDVLDRIGIRNAYTGPTSAWGHATIGLDAMAAMPADTRLLILSARIADPQALLAIRPLYRALPMIRTDRVTILSDILFYGGLPSADRFARLLAERLPPDIDGRG